MKLIGDAVVCVGVVALCVVQCVVIAVEANRTFRRLDNVVNEMKRWR